MRWWQQLKERLAHRYRLIIVDDASYQQSAAVQFTLGRMAAFLVGAAFVIFFTTALLIVFTPVREWIPGYTDPALKQQQTVLLGKLRDMESIVARQDSFIKALQRVSGIAPDTAAAQAGTPVVPQSGRGTYPAARTPVHRMSWRPAAPQGTGDVLLFPPLAEGRITQGFNAAARHYAVDIAAPAGTPVLAVADGTVMLSEYATQTGHLLAVQHADGWVSVYKHCRQRLAAAGATVRAGEAIAQVGNTGTHTTGPHLHFELWRNRQPLDPLRFLAIPVRG